MYKECSPTFYQNRFMNVKPILLLVLALNTAIITAQRKPRIKGNRAVVEVRQSLPAFHAITLLDDLDISLEEAAEPGYVIEADDNLIDVLKFEVSSDTLYVRSFYNIAAKKKLDIRILYTELNAITLKEGRMESKDIISSENLAIRTSGITKLQLNTRSTHLHLHMDGQSSGDFNLECDSVKVVLKDRSDARIYLSSDHLDINMNGNSDAFLEGNTTTMELDIKNGSDLKAERTAAGTVKATLDDTASAHLRPTESLELTSRGSANTYLYGDGQITITEFRDTSKLYKRTD